MFIPFHDDNPIRIRPFVTIAIVAINAILFFYTARLGDHERRLFVAKHAFIPARLAQLSDPRPMVYDLYPDAQQLRQRGRHVPNERFVEFLPSQSDIAESFISSLFLHGSFMHLIGNMWFFWIFGNNIEDRLGHIGFLLFYLTGGVFASACHWLFGGMGTLPVIGASGAVAVTLGSYAVLYPFARVRTLLFLVVFFTVVELPALIVLGFWFIVQLFNGFGSLEQFDHSGVAWWAHIGGFLFGALIMPLISMGTPEPGEDWRAEADRQFDFERMTRPD